MKTRTVFFKILNAELTDCTVSFEFRKVQREIQQGEDRKTTKKKLAGLYVFQNTLFYSKRWGALCCYTLPVTIFFLIMFSYDYQ